MCVCLCVCKHLCVHVSMHQMYILDIHVSCIALCDLYRWS